jgi:hypothetical protein
MGLRCLLGHDFGPPEIEREREETGDEMVVTVRETETCRRCGEERVVSENKEVTAIRSPSEVDLDDGADASDSPDGPDARAKAAEPGDSTEPTSSSTGSTTDAGGVDVAPEGSDDGVILDDDERAQVFPGVTVHKDGHAHVIEADAETVDSRVFVFVEDQFGEDSYELLAED